jgi:nitrite reductase (NADH) small subunit
VGTWLDAGAYDDLVKRRKLVIENGDRPIFVLAHDGAVRAFANICIHKQRELSKGVILNGRVICPGHQWAFDLATGWEAKMERCQPTFDVRVEDGRVLVDLDSSDRRAEDAALAHGASNRGETDGRDSDPQQVPSG